jgi:glycosyltransferase involved in cell wall biosynthesis
MTQKPFFTVIVPTYNQTSYLGPALDSLLAQTDPDWEAVIVNDGSTDATPEVLKAYGKRDARIRVHHKENGGVASALNVGLDHAKGHWICWLSSDDLFESTKLEQHRKSIITAPECRFFFSHFRYLHETTGLITDPPLWRDIPDQRWQVLEMLRGTFIHGNSICINREAWLRVGRFDENLRQGQDYDMWLRLVARYPATFIPERTCITRWHAAQTTNYFPEAGFFDSTKAAINFLNQHRFAELVPLVDLDDPELALAALERALEIAQTADSPFLYSLGPHPALLLRILEWVWNRTDNDFAAVARRVVRNRANWVSKKYEGTTLGFLWKGASVATRLPQNNFAYESVSPMEVAERYYWDLEAHGDARAEKLHRYLDRVEKGRLRSDVSSTIGEVKEVIFVNQPGMTIGNSGVYGTLRVTLERAKYLIRSGVKVVIVAMSDNGLSMCEGVLVVGVKNEDSLLQALGLWGPADTVVGISRADFLMKVRAKRVVVYHHNASAVPWFPVDTVLSKVFNRPRVPVICVSHFSEDCLVGFGVSADMVHVVSNGVHVGRFCFKADCARPAHSLIFAGHMVDYKGIDIALRAFAVLKARFPDASFDAYGKYFTWRGRPIGWSADKEHVFTAGWLDENGFLVWNAIERELPGFHYRGEVPHQELARAFRTHSLLIMPSRIAETFGLVSLEAQAGGCIPVLPRQGGFPETIREGITGYLYDTNTPEGLAAKITELWDQNLPAEGQRVEAQAWVCEAFSWEKSGKEFLRVIEAIPISKRSHYSKWLLCLDAAYWRWTITRIYYGLLRRTGPFRHALGLRKETIRRLMRWNSNATRS